MTLGQQFDDNIAGDVRSLELDPKDLDGLPDDFKRAHAPGANGKVTLTTNNTDYQPFMTYATSATARAAFWKLYRLRAHPKNGPVLQRMLEARRELAGKLGFATWADYITGDKMIGTPQNVADFIDRITAASDRRMKSDYASLLARRQKDVPGASFVDAWDSSYYQEKVKAEQYNFDSQSVRPYFEYSRVKQGVLDITGQMFGITYRPVRDAAVWHEDVEVYDVLEGDARPRPDDNGCAGRQGRCFRGALRPQARRCRRCRSCPAAQAGCILGVQAPSRSDRRTCWDISARCIRARWKRSAPMAR